MALMVLQADWLHGQAERVPLLAGAVLPIKSTNAFVGKIAATVDDTVMRALLEACGPIKSWKRMTVRPWLCPLASCIGARQHTQPGASAMLPL